MIQLVGQKQILFKEESIMKRNISKNMSREQIIASMAKKLAEKGSSEIIIKKKPSDKYIYFISAAVLLAVLLIGTFISINKKDTVQQNQEPKKIPTPISLPSKVLMNSRKSSVWAAMVNRPKQNIIRLRANFIFHSHRKPRPGRPETQRYRSMHRAAVPL